MARSRGRFGPEWLLLVVTPLALVLVGGWIWSFAPSSIAVSGSDVLIERNMAGDIRIPLETARVRAVTEDDLRALRRTNGVSVGSLRFGQFSSDRLGRFEFYARRSGPLFVIQNGDRVVVVQPDDPSAFDKIRRP